MDPKLLSLIASLAIAATVFFQKQTSLETREKISENFPQFNHFDSFKEKHGKNYNNAEEESYRFTVYT